METKTVGVLAVVNDKGEVVAIVHHNEKIREQQLMLCTKAGVEDYQKLFDEMLRHEQNVG